MSYLGQMGVDGFGDGGTPKRAEPISDSALYISERFSLPLHPDRPASARPLRD